MNESKLEVYKAITNIIKEMSMQGISKDKKAGSGSFGFNFRGIDDVFNALSPLMAKHGLIIFPRVLSRECIERKTNKGGAIFYTVINMEYDFVSSIDGSKHTVSVIGEAADSGDKSSNKAMSIALKYAAFQVFFIPTEVTAQDADYDIHSVQSLPVLPIIEGELETAIKSWIGSGATFDQVIIKLQGKYFIDESSAKRVFSIKIDGGEKS